MDYLYHLTSWPYQGETALTPPSLQSEGFVHLSSADQVQRTARRWYGDQSRLGVLVLDPTTWGEALRWEDSYGHGEAFPHLYREIPSDSVVAVLRLDQDVTGDFPWPKLWQIDGSPLQDGPDEGTALIEPSRRFPHPVLPEHAVLTLFPGSLEALDVRPDAKILERPGSAIGPARVLTLQHREHEIAVCSPGVGGPLSSAALEELIALGCRKFVLCGGAGALLPELNLGSVVLVESALRDEGVSHHYLPTSPSVTVDAAALRTVEERLQTLGAKYSKGATWTTDALYRETPSRIERRRDAGALTVEMECASLLAVAQFRDVPLVPLLFCGDSLASTVWDFRDWTSAADLHERVLWLAVEAVTAL